MANPSPPLWERTTVDPFGNGTRPGIGSMIGLKDRGTPGCRSKNPSQFGPNTRVPDPWMQEAMCRVKETPLVRVSAKPEIKITT